MNTDANKIQFFKEKILNRIEELKPYMSNVKYKLYISMINDCTKLSDIREMAELDMQFNMIKYIKELDEKLKMCNTNIEELEAVANQNTKAAKLTIIKPKKKEAKTNIEIANDIDFSTLGEDIEDEEILASAANLLMMRLNNTPAEELYDYDNEYEDLTEDDVDNIDFEDTEDYDTDIDENDDDDADLEYDIDENDLEFYEDEDDTDNNEDIELEFEDEDDDEDIIDFGLTNEKTVDENELDFEIEEDTNEYIEEYEDNEEEDETDWDTLGDDMFIDSEEDDFEDEDETDWDSLGDDLFVDNDSEEDEDDIDEDETDWDSLGDDMFSDESDDSYDDEDESEETDWDSLGDDMFSDESDEDNFDFDDDTSDESGTDSIDNIDADDLFGDDSDEDEESSEDDMFDIDESEFDFEEPDEEDDNGEFDDFFARNTTSTNSNKAIKRENTPNKVFINGTKRGDQTQQMFNMLNNMLGGAGKLFKKTGHSVKRTAIKGVDYINNSDYFKLNS